ncbi:MAG: hypothetical protein ABEJ84_08455 [Halodesulfurarchaeum sp.]
MDGRRGQSETLGYALILGFTLISVGALLTVGGTSLQMSQDRIGVQSAEIAMSQFDSRASMVALGEQTTQTVELGTTQQGTYTVEPDAGWLRVVHKNRTANETTVLYNGTLGAVTYHNGAREIGYQGGGIWWKDGGSVMRSPPEFHFRETTLTLPIVQIRGQGSVSGNARAVIRQTRDGDRIFPTVSADEPTTNPVQSGTVSVTVKSDYYAAWADFFRTRTDGNVSENASRNTATVTLIAPVTHGDFDMPLDGNSMTLQGIRTHQIDQFTLTLIDDQGDQANFENLDWSICAKSGGQEFEVQVSKGTGTGDGDTARTIIYYSPDGTNYQTWTTDAFRFEAESEGETGDWNGDGDYEDTRLVVNLTSRANATYREQSVQSFSNCAFSATSFEPSPTFEGHEAEGEPVEYEIDERAPIDFVTNHYLALVGPTVELTVADSSQNTVSEKISTGYLGYNASVGSYLTYMHITENPVNVTIE